MRKRYGAEGCSILGMLVEGLALRSDYGSYLLAESYAASERESMAGDSFEDGDR
jgi:hypothetical protein